MAQKARCTDQPIDKHRPMDRLPDRPKWWPIRTRTGRKSRSGAAALLLLQLHSDSLPLFLGLSPQSWRAGAFGSSKIRGVHSGAMGSSNIRGVHYNSQSDKQKFDKENLFDKSKRFHILLKFTYFCTENVFFYKASKYFSIIFDQIWSLLTIGLLVFSVFSLNFG